MSVQGHGRAGHGDGPALDVGAAEAPASTAAPGAVAPAPTRGAECNTIREIAAPELAKRPWKSPGLDPYAFIKAVAKDDPRVYLGSTSTPAAAEDPCRINLDFGEAARIISSYDAAPAGRKPSLAQLEEAYLASAAVRNGGRRYIFSDQAAEYTLAVHCVLSDAAAAGRSAAAEAALAKVKDLLGTSIVDWRVSGGDREQAAGILAGLKPEEALWVCDQLRKIPDGSGSKLQVLLRGDTNPAAASLRDHFTALASKMGLGEKKGAFVMTSMEHVGGLWGNQLRGNP